MRRAILLFLLLLLAAVPIGATQVFLRQIISELGSPWTTGYTGYGCNNLNGNNTRQATNTAAGASVVSLTHTPNATAPPCQVSGAANYFFWVSPPLSSGVTISGNIDFNISCSESAAQLNAGMRMIVSRWSVKVGGIVSIIITSANTAECNNTRLAIAAAAPTSTVMDVGDRLVFKVEITNVGGAWGGDSVRTVIISYNAASGVLGDTFANFADTLAFAADSNNGRAVVSENRRARPLADSFIRWRTIP